ncbi:hypothetical protein J6590_053289 [Homalodisca vitripennis]|nr:hypothetical protein J6590_053289 [Homalodisca vitripennis]
MHHFIYGRRLQYSICDSQPHRKVPHTTCAFKANAHPVICIPGYERNDFVLCGYMFDLLLRQQAAAHRAGNGEGGEEGAGRKREKELDHFFVHV